MKRSSLPPKWINSLLTKVCKPELLEEIEGDLLEYYQLWVEKYGSKKANRLYVFHAIKFLRPFAIKKSKSHSSNSLTMLRHSLLLSFRNFKRYKSSFLINLIGLSCGLACTLFIYLWVNDELSVDKFHEHEGQLYKVIEHVKFDGSGVTTWKETSGPMAKALREEMPEVEFAAAVIPGSWFGKTSLSVGEHDIKANAYYVEKDFFNIFSYELISGNKDQVLSDINSIVLSEKLALTLFNTTENVIGKTVEFEQERQFQVSGIFENIPSNSTAQFDFVLSFELLKDKPLGVDSWGNLGPQVYAVLKKGTLIDDLNEKVGMIVKNMYKESTRTPSLIPYSQDYLCGTYENGIQIGGRIEYVRLFSIVALFILSIACINFMNLSTARASRRVKEIGVKKAMGANRMAFVFQFLTESIFITGLALIVALLLVILLLPQFNEVIGKQLALELNANLVFRAFAIVLCTGLMAGSYPALYLSSFNIINALKGKLSSSIGELWTRKGLVIIQFTLSIILILSVLVVYKQIGFVQNRNLGYDKDNIVHFKVEGTIKKQLESFVFELKKIPGIVNASSTTHDMVGHNWSVGIDWEGRDRDKPISFQVVGVDYDLIETLEMEITTGHSFSKDFGSDSKGIIFNETAIKAMGLSDPIGKTIRFMGEKKIIGTVKDFHFKSLHETVEPLFLVMMPEAVKKVMVRIEAGREREAIEKVRAFYENFNPGFPFEYQFLNEDYATLYASEQRVATLSKYFAAIAIMISCLGLFGLAAFSAERRMKEIGVRKTLGSSVFGIVRLLSEDFTKMVIFSITIALPISYLVAKEWLDSFAYRIALEWWYFAFAGLSALLIAWLTVGFQTYNAARINPVKCLRDE